MDPHRTKLIVFNDFAAFVGEVKGPEAADFLPPLPLNLPQLPEGFCSRPDLEDKIISMLVSDNKKDLLAQGMGVSFVNDLIRCNHCAFFSCRPHIFRSQPRA